MFWAPLRCPSPDRVSGTAAAQGSHFPDENIYLMLRTAVLLERLESVQSILCVHIPGKKSLFFCRKVLNKDTIYLLFLDIRFTTANWPERKKSVILRMSDHHFRILGSLTHLSNMSLKGSQNFGRNINYLQKLYNGFWCDFLHSTIFCLNLN